METIGINHLRNLVEERVSNPRKYNGSTLLLWNGKYTKDSMIYQIIEECCTVFNQSHSCISEIPSIFSSSMRTAISEEARWVKYSDFLFNEDDNTLIETTIPDMSGWCRKGILFNTGCFRNDTDTKEAWLKFINTHTNTKGGISSDWALIACAQAKDYDFVPEMFDENCIIYEFRPGFDEWAGYVRPMYHQGVVEPAISFIRDNGFKMDPFYWGRVMSEHEDQLEKFNVDSLEELSQEDFLFNGGCSSCENFCEVMQEYYNYIHREK